MSGLQLLVYQRQGPDLSALSNLTASQQSAVTTASSSVSPTNPQSVVDALAAGDWFDGKAGNNYEDISRTTIAAAGSAVQSMTSASSSNVAVQSAAARSPTQQANNLSFDGVNDYLDLSSFFPSDPSTFMLVFGFQTSSHAMLFGHRSESTRLIQINLTTATSAFQLRDSTNVLRSLAFPSSPVTATPQIVAVVFDKTGIQKLRHNFVEVASQTIAYTGSFTSSQSRVGAYAITADPASVFLPMNGDLFGFYVAQTVNESNVELVESFINEYYSLGL